MFFRRRWWRRQPLRSQERRKAVFARVQKHWLILAAVWFLLAAGGLTLADAKPNASEADLPEKPFLLVVESTVSPLSAHNRLTLKKLEDAGLKIVRVNAGKDGAAAMPWFAAYEKFYTPLTILFTNRHKQGIVLPERLDKVDFSKALAKFQ